MKTIETELWREQFDKDGKLIRIKRHKLRSIDDPTRFSVTAFGVSWILDGAEAYKEGLFDNPHPKGSTAHTLWRLGFDVACQRQR